MMRASVLKRNLFRSENVRCDYDLLDKCYNWLHFIIPRNQRFVTNPLEDKGSREWDETDIRYVSLGFF
jgi:hypothetical protein